MVVIGNIDIKGSWFDSYSETSIAGNLEIQNDLFTEGNLSVGGNLSAKLIYFSFNQGFATIVGNCNSKVLIERDHGGSWIFGKINSNYLVFDELKMVNKKTANKTKLMKNLANLFKPEIISTLLENSSEMDTNDIYEEFLNILYDTFSNKKQISI